ncbi:MAG: hypothetical protein KatS3mg117_1430 [Geminicoccaceae bacterium]|jgi:hypothetical protein|nr:MAG: hypothetical protein KatS3mg117_1430 [Geminicoccaceae bacterium]
MVGGRLPPFAAAVPTSPGALAITAALLFSVGCSEPTPEPGPTVPAVEPAAVEPPPTGGGPYRARGWQEATRETFRRLDRNRDGKLDLEEIRTGLAVLDLDGDGWVSRHEAWQLVEAGDRDRDGRLSRAELERLSSLRLEMDRDGDGRVSALEFSLARTDEFVRADLDRNGVVTPEEWRRVPRFTLFRF